MMGKLNYAVKKNSVTLFNQRYLLSIGGQGEDGHPLQIIEM